MLVDDFLTLVCSLSFESAMFLVAAASDAGTATVRRVELLLEDVAREHQQQPVLLPRSIAFLVESLATAVPARLALVSESWPLLPSLPLVQLVRGAYDPLLVAWESAIRHIAPVRQLMESQLRCGVPMIDTEVDVCFAAPDPSDGNIGTIIESLSSGGISYAGIRKLDKAVLGGQIDEGALTTLLTTPSGFRWELLRVFRGRSHCLSNLAKEFLHKSLLRSLDESLVGDWTADLCIALEIADSPQIYAAARARLAAVLPGARLREAQVYMTLLLLDRGWKMP